MNTTRFGLISRIALLVVCVEIAAFSALGWFYVSRFSSAIVGRTQARLQLVAQMIGSNELPITSVARPELMSDMLGASYLDGQVIGGNGMIIVSTQPAQLGRQAREMRGFDPAWFEESRHEFFTNEPGRMTSLTHIHADPTEPPVYYVVQTISTAELEATKRSIILWGVLGSGIFVLLSSAGIIFIAQRLITRRVNRSLQVLKLVEEGALDARIPISAMDELGQLQRGVNSMTEKLGTLLTQQRSNSDELKKQKDLLTDIIQHAPIRVFWKDRDCRYTGCNDQFARDAGMASVDEVIGKTDFDMGWRDQAEIYRADDQAVMRSGVPKLEFEEPQTTPDGRTIWLSTSKVPLRGPDNQVIGVLGIYSDVTGRKQAEAQILNLAHYDSLTSLPNRRLLMDRLHHAVATGARQGQYGALLMLDLDNFKDLNDSSGHDVGDLLLIEVGKRLTRCTRQSDTVARLGGDEYVVVAEALGSEEAAAAVQAKGIAEKVRQVLDEPYMLQAGGVTHYCTASVGVTLFHDDTTPVEVLLKQADVALYQAKSAGRNTIRFFNTTMQTAIDERARMATGLRNGMERGEFHLYYQPQIDRHGRLIGAEALLRWLPADAPPVPPAVFIPLAEETGLIFPLGDWVLAQACRRLKEWEQRPETRALVLAINISAHQFRQPEFVEQVRSHVGRSGIDPAKLKLEVTESVMLAQQEEVVSRMARLTDVGVGIALDDFGTGFSSLAYVKRLPLDQVKIDQSFIQDISYNQNDAAIVRAILAMSRSLGLKVIAEGVETEAQRDFLLAHGCENFQGYLFGKPLPFEEWPELISLGPGVAALRR